MSTAAFNDYYKMNHKSRGQVVIINNYEFENPKYKSLIEQKKNVSKYKETFKILGFKENEIKVFENQSALQMKNTMNGYAKKDFTHCDCFIGVFLSYGYLSFYKPFVMGTDQGILYEQLVDVFKQTTSLSNKPKIFYMDIFKKESAIKGFLSNPLSILTSFFGPKLSNSKIESEERQPILTYAASTK
jgi:hypothetical protein